MSLPPGKPVPHRAVLPAIPIPGIVKRPPPWARLTPHRCARDTSVEGRRRSLDQTLTSGGPVGLSEPGVTTQQRHLPKTPGVLLVILVLATLWGCNDKNKKVDRDSFKPVAPAAAMRPHHLAGPNDSRLDEYYWLRDDTGNNKEVLRLLRAENRFTEIALSPVDALEDRLHEEIALRHPVSVSSTPVQIGDYQYSREFRAAREHPVYMRQLAGGRPEVILDVNLLAEGHAYYRVENWAVSDDGQLLAFLEDTSGRREYRLRFRDLAKGIYLPAAVARVADTLAWDDSKHLVYVALDDQERPAQVMRCNPLADCRGTTVHVVINPAHHASVYRSRSGRHVFVRVQGASHDEFRVVAGDSAPELLASATGRQYRVRDVGATAYVLTNLEAPDYRLITAPFATLHNQNTWRDVIPAQPGHRIEDFEVFEQHIVLLERHAAHQRIRVSQRDPVSFHTIDMGGEPLAISLLGNPDPASRILRYRVSSLTRPPEDHEYEMDTRFSRRVRGTRIPGFDPARYTSKAVSATARDGAEIPVTLAYRRDRFRRSDNPLYLTAYGAYGVTLDPVFRPEWISLMDRGFVVGIVHVRGGQAKGRGWHEAGRGFAKRHTFEDFVDATDELVELTRDPG